MYILEVLLISLSVSIDAFAVSVGGSLCGRSAHRFRDAARAALFFGGFQFLMPVLGYLAAALLAGAVKSLDHWIAFLLLSFVGGNMIRGAYEKEERTPDLPVGISGTAESGNAQDSSGGEKGCIPCSSSSSSSAGSDFFSPRKLFLPAVATSIDALAVGAGLKFAGSGILFPALSMGIVTALISALGVLIGGRLASLAGERIMTVAGGSAIILIGFKILLEHLGVLHF